MKKVFFVIMMLSSFLYSTIHEDAEDGKINRWVAPAGATVSNVVDSDTNSKVIQLSSNTLQYYKLTKLANNSDNEISWDIKANYGFTAYIVVLTSLGERTLYYSTTTINRSRTGNWIHHPLGDLKKNTWHPITRDLEADLQDFEQNNHVTAIKSFKIRTQGNTSLDNISSNSNSNSNPIDTTPPVIKLNGNATETISLNGVYSEQGATALDETDGIVAVTTNGTVDTSTAGIYTVTYSATDSAGNSATKNRTVTVQDNGTCSVIEDAEDGNTDGWIASVTGATITNIVDSDTGSNVIQLSSSSHTYYRMENLNHSSKKIKWDIKANHGFTTYIVVLTSFGERTLYYSTTTTNRSRTGNWIHHPLGDLKKNTWHPITRDLEADLQDFESNNHVTAIKSFKIRIMGNASLDNLEACDGSTVPNRRPVAEAGMDQTVANSTQVQLDGSASNDADNDPLTYQWTMTSKPNGSSAILSDATLINPTFVVDIDGAYTLQLIVNDGIVDSVADTVIISVGNNDEEPIVHINNFNDPVVNTKHNVHAVGLDMSEGTLKLLLDGGSGDTTFPFIWVANSGEGTISLLSTETGNELGRYRTGPTSGGNPSRTTVDQDGNVWVGNRNGNTITKIGLKVWDQCIDRNGNGIIDTSTGGSDVKPWTGSFGDGQGITNAEDECILQHVTLSKDGLSANAVRLVAIDPDNNVFAGGYYSNPIFKVNGATGAIINAVPSLQGHYGGVVDKDGNLWSMSSGSGKVQKISNDMSLQELISLGHGGYGITIDKYGKVWTTQYRSSKFSTFDPSNPVGTLQVFNQTGHSSAQGIASDANGDIFIAGSLGSTSVGQYRQTFDGDGNFTGVEFVKNHIVQSSPTGVAIDATGKVWASNEGSNSVSRIDPITEVVEHFPVGTGPYNYSDMTGNVVRTITKKQGTWEATFDGEVDDYSWNKLKWRLTEALPAGTDIKVFTKVANIEINLASQVYVEIQNGVPFNLNGRYLKIKIELTSNNLTDTPKLVEIKLF